MFRVAKARHTEDASREQAGLVSTRKIPRSIHVIGAIKTMPGIGINNSIHKETRGRGKRTACQERRKNR